MNRDKQIEQMAADIRLNMQVQPNPKEHPSHQLARLLVEDGYRKTSEVVREIIDILKSAGIDEWRYPVIAELKKKYAEDGNE